MSRRIVFRPRAQADLRAIGDYSDARWGDAQARRYLTQIADELDRIASMPALGADCSEVAPGLRRWRSGSHHIYYRAAGADTVLIVRVLHERMDVAQARMTLQSPASGYRAER